MKRSAQVSYSAACLGLLALLPSLSAQTFKQLVDVPDYQWHAGCFGTANGNLAGYWDRHGFPNYYTGIVGGGVAPLNSVGSVNGHIVGLWASQAGVDGRPANQPGHMDDYYVGYESTAPDPYVTAGRAEHEPDCIGDFIGLNQKKWTNLNGECDGNIDAYSFVYWDASGEKRVNFTPSAAAGNPAVDIQSGLRNWVKWRGYEADTFTQLTDFNPHVPEGKGFTFEDLMAEIDAGYPVLLFMQPFNRNSRNLLGMTNANPNIHGMLAYGYYIDPSGDRFCLYRTSWGSGDNQLSQWNDDNWTPKGQLNLPLRGVIGFRPKPQIMETEFAGNDLTLRWHGPDSEVLDRVQGGTRKVHYYVIERAEQIDGTYTPITEPTTGREATVPLGTTPSGFFRVKLVPPPPEG